MSEHLSRFLIALIDRLAQPTTMIGIAVIFIVFQSREALDYSGIVNVLIGAALIYIDEFKTARASYQSLAEGSSDPRAAAFDTALSAGSIILQLLKKFVWR